MAEKAAAKGKGGKAARKEGKKLSALYISTGQRIERKNKSCPKCGPGVFLAAHQDRAVCGKCKYVEFGKR